RLDEPEVHSLRKPADVVVRLDDRGGPADRLGLDAVGVDRALREVFDPAQARGLVLEDLDERLPDDLPLVLRIDDPLQTLEEEIPVPQHTDIEMVLGAEATLDLIRLTLSQRPRVHEQAHETLADRPVDQEGHDGRVDPAGQSTDDAAIAHLT